MDKEDLRLILAACIAAGHLARGEATPKTIGWAFDMADQLIEYQTREKEGEAQK